MTGTVEFMLKDVIGERGRTQTRHGRCNRRPRAAKQTFTLAYRESEVSCADNGVAAVNCLHFGSAPPPSYSSFRRCFPRAAFGYPTKRTRAMLDHRDVLLLWLAAAFTIIGEYSFLAVRIGQRQQLVSRSVPRVCNDERIIRRITGHRTLLAREANLNFAIVRHRKGGNGMQVPADVEPTLGITRRTWQSKSTKNDGK